MKILISHYDFQGYNSLYDDSKITRAFATHPIAALLGPRQCGKTTLARLIAEREPSTYFDLENPIDIRRLSAPMRTLEPLTGLASD